MSNSASVTHLRSSRWCSVASHTLAVVAGVAPAVILGPHTAQSIGPLLRPPRPDPANQFHHALQTVMVQMAAGMCITPSADAVRDFTRAMIPHHQGAVEMEKLEFLYGSDPCLRRLAQGVVVDQSQEIALMRRILADRTPALGPNLKP